MALVSRLVQDGLHSDLRKCLTIVALIELDVVLSLLRDFRANDSSNERFINHGANFSTIIVYNLITREDNEDTMLIPFCPPTFLLKSRSPGFFGGGRGVDSQLQS